jgi:hypothetical protein
MVELSVPERFRPGLVKLLGLPPQSVDELVSALNTAPGTLSPLKLLASIQPHVRTIPADDLESILDTLRSLYVLLARLDLTIDDCVHSVANAIERGDYADLGFQDKDRVEFEQQLRRLLGINSHTVEAKALDLLVEHERVFHDARIITDLRPVFGTEVTAPPAAGLILHTLKITYHEGSELKEFFVALDSGELDLLSSIIDRAKQKGSTIEQLLVTANVPRLEFA